MSKLPNLLLLFIAALVPFFLYLLPNLDLRWLLKYFDVYTPFWIFSLQLGLGLLLFAKLFKDFAQWVKNILSLQSFIFVFFITAVAVFICLAWIEPTSRVQADESVYLATAQNLYHNQIGIHCMEGTFVKEGGLSCVIKESVKARGISYLYMLGMPIFGKDLHWVYNFQTFILALTLPTFFLAIMAWLRNAPLALISTALLSSCPILLFLSRSSSPEGLYVFLSALSLLFLKWAYDKNTIRHWLLLALTLAFFAQTRTETIFCLFSFIAVVWWKTSSPLTKLSTLNSQLSTFLATLSFFCIPILCTISMGRDNNLQGGAYSAYGHLFENIIINFKVMTLPVIHNPYDKHFMPYFTWLALFGFITLLILTIKEFIDKKTMLAIPYKFIFGFFLLYHIQSLILFDAVSADFRLDVQHRFSLVVLPTMAFLGALFLYQTAIFLARVKFLGNINYKIPLTGTIIIILANLLLFYEHFESEKSHKMSSLLIEDKIIRKFVTTDDSKPKLLFHGNPTISIGYGSSAYTYISVFAFDSLDVQEMIKEYDGEVYFVKGFFCGYDNSAPKMVVGSVGPICERFDVYFNTEYVLDTTFITYGNRSRELAIQRITGLTDRDPKNLLRIFYRTERNDSLKLDYIMLKRDSVPWKIQSFANDSLITEKKYELGFGFDFYPFEVFNKDTNRIDMRIIDTITGEQIHSDYWKLLRKNDN